MVMKVGRSIVHAPALKYWTPSRSTAFASCVCPQKTRVAPLSRASANAPSVTFSDNRSQRVSSRSSKRASRRQFESNL